MSKNINYQQYICKGAHCKCMNLDGKCTNYHNGDHTCPSSSSGATEESHIPVTPTNTLSELEKILRDIEAATLIDWTNEPRQKAKQALTTHISKEVAKELKLIKDGWVKIQDNSEITGHADMYARGYNDAIAAAHTLIDEEIKKLEE